MHNLDLDKYKNFFIIIVIIVVLYFLYRYKNEHNKKRVLVAKNNIVSEGKSCGSNCALPESNVTHEFLQSNSPFESFENNNLPVFNLYYTDWCGWSQKFLPVWTKLENTVNNSNLKDKVKLQKINCVSEKAKCDGVPGFPYLILNKNGKKIKFEQNRDLPTLESFLNTNC